MFFRCSLTPAVFPVFVTMVRAQDRLLAAAGGSHGGAVEVRRVVPADLDSIAAELVMGEDLGDALAALFPSAAPDPVHQIALFLINQGATDRINILWILRTMGGQAVLDFASRAQPPLNLFVLSSLEHMVRVANQERQPAEAPRAAMDDSSVAAAS